MNISPEISKVSYCLCVLFSIFAGAAPKWLPPQEGRKRYSQTISKKVINY